MQIKYLTNVNRQRLMKTGLNNIEEIKMNIELTYNGNVAAMSIEGILNSENAHVLQEKLVEVLASSATLLELDLFECKNISSTGIGKILLFYKDFIGRSGEIEVVRSSNSVYELFSMLKLNQLFTVNLG